GPARGPHRPLIAGNCRYRGGKARCIRRSVDGPSAPGKWNLRPCRGVQVPAAPIFGNRRPAATTSNARGIRMLKWALIFLVISIIAGALGFTGVSAAAAGIAKILFAVFLVLAIIFVLIGVLGIAAL